MADIENGLSDLDVKSNRDLQKEKTVSILTSLKFLARGLTRI